MRNTETVFCKLRVSSPPPTSLATNILSTPPSTKRQHRAQRTFIYNGVSANSWLLPIGICQKVDSFQPKQIRKSYTQDDQINKAFIPHRERSAVVLKAKDASEKTTFVEERDKDEQCDQVNKGNQNRDSTNLPTLNDGVMDECNTDATSKTARKAYPMEASEFDSLWGRVSQRPHNTGSIFIVRRPNFPVGIGREEFLQGTQLRSKVAVESQRGEDKTGVRLKPRPFTAPARSTSDTVFDRPTSPRVFRPFSPIGVRTKAVFNHSSNVSPLAVPPPNSSMDLVVTPLRLSMIAAQDSNQDHRQESLKPVFSPARPKSRSAHIKGRGLQTSLDTIDGIKRSYLRRAKSAPPKTRTVDTNSTAATTPRGPPCADYVAGLTDSRGPSLYWRARSSYHKRLMTYGPEDKPDPNDQTLSLPGSFWRPLMMDEDLGVMQHSAGCPYKCKGCFKACLVSEDYLQKARAQKALEEKKLARQSKGNPDPSREQTSSGISTGQRAKRPTCNYRGKVNDPHNLVSIAIAKNQPLYQLVHGKKAGGNRPAEGQRSDGDAENFCGDCEVTATTVGDRNPEGSGVAFLGDGDDERNGNAVLRVDEKCGSNGSPITDDGKGKGTGDTCITLGDKKCTMNGTAISNDGECDKDVATVL